jgi:hypothetical protein
MDVVAKLARIAAAESRQDGRALNRTLRVTTGV